MDEDIICQFCGCENHVHDYREFDRICTNCGITSYIYYEQDATVYKASYGNKRKNHFKTNIMNLLVQNNVILSGFEIDHLYVMFETFTRTYEDKKHLVKRKSMMKYSFVIQKLLIEMGKEEEARKIKPPKLVKTLEKLELDWNMIFCRQ